MISYLTSADMSIIAFIGVIFAFALTCIAIAKLNKFLPKDLGRQFAVDGKLSAGKPRGAGIIFIFTFVISAVLFSQINAEIAIYLVLIVIEMLTGYFDDAAEKPHLILRLPLLWQLCICISTQAQSPLPYLAAL